MSKKKVYTICSIFGYTLALVFCLLINWRLIIVLFSFRWALMLEMEVN
jgi:hypothetical protein